MDHIGRGQITNLTDFLHRLSDCVKNGRSNNTINKTQCQAIKENLNRMVTKTGADTNEVSTIRLVLNHAENGRLENLTTENIEKALDENRCLMSYSTHGKHERDNRKQQSITTGQQHVVPTMTNEQEHQQRQQQYNHQRQEQQQEMMKRDRHEDHMMGRSVNRGKPDHYMEKEEMAREIYELKMRLSSMAGDKLKDGNPSLADLNDPNRPTSIAEQYRELYDNGWTNALEELTKDKITDKQAILELGNILQQSYEMTRRLSNESTNAMTDVIKASLSNIGNQHQITRTSGSGKETTRSITGHVMAIKRENVEMSIPSVQNHCMEQLHVNRRQRFPTYVDGYAKQCARLTWLMNIQDPPLVLKWAKEGERFDSQYFNEFTRSGTIVEFTSWPALLIHENGAILAKGTVQPRKK
ncbi:probable E3 ubiquitin-protein ligase bre1 [Pecten maximus]|uniref:probable E3 ubiquitin-protein ligase bre1 n=1 Tax=Pecten maximus TaxID=6579 RepID=UPI0014581DA8|nr:probable E3 ubiquitin-protein ligase bre1 [Pecten maximus]